MTRPAVDVVIPFAGSSAELGAVLGRAAALRTRDGDTVTVVDNEARPGRPPAPAGVALLEAASRRSSYHARNAGAAAGRASWILFVDADVDVPEDLLNRYFTQPPGERTAIVAGAVRDAPGPGLAARYAVLTDAMAQPTAYALTANCLVRRAAFGGFAEVRSGGDADLSFRLLAAGWELEHRTDAAVFHRGRSSVLRLLRQRARHGSGAAWVERRHPGSFPARPLPGVARHAVRRAGQGVAALARGERDEALVALLDGPALVAFELGRRLPNDS